jgi:hypothetical protein
MITLRSQAARPPAEWALWQRMLIRQMDEAAPIYQDRYTRQDGTFVWREAWPGFDGSDDGYESYGNWPLYYALGGSSEIHERSRTAWEAVTKQFTGYGQVYREFDANYDWMHHGESSIYFYFYGLADPNRLRDRARALRFAAMYIGEDPEAPNYDPARRMMRSPINGSRGPRTVNQWDDWSTHRWVLAEYPVPFEDIPGVSTPIADWKKDEVYAEILKLLNKRMMSGDVPLNLTSTSLITTAFMYTGDDKYRRWVLDYLEAWNDRIQANGGICPDNVGPNGVIGECMDGKWWGGYYGWRWPHGLNTIIQPLTIASMNAVLVSGDMSYLDIPRGQLDRLLELGQVTEDGVRIPNRRMDSGWADYRFMNPEYPVQLWYMSQAQGDRDRLEALPKKLTTGRQRLDKDGKPLPKTDLGPDRTWNTVLPGRGKGDDIHIAPWFQYLAGENPDYPRLILEAQWAEVRQRMVTMATDDGNPEEWDCHHWQQINPVHTEGLMQLTCGGPQIIYHGGLAHLRVRYYDPDQRRPGLPPDVAALVHTLTPDGVQLTLSNTHARQPHKVILQAGAFGEHRFTTAQDLAAAESQPVDVNDKWFQVELVPGGVMELKLGMERYVNTPSFQQPAM